eukprot:gene341-1773_t
MPGKRKAAGPADGEAGPKKKGCPVSKADFLKKAEDKTFKVTLSPKEMSGG